MKILFIIFYIIMFLVVYVLVRKENYFWRDYALIVGAFVIAVVWPFSLMFFAIVCLIEGLDWIVRKLFDR